MLDIQGGAPSLGLALHTQSCLACWEALLGSRVSSVNHCFFSLILSVFIFVVVSMTSQPPCLRCGHSPLSMLLFVCHRPKVTRPGCQRGHGELRLLPGH